METTEIIKWMLVNGGVAGGVGAGIALGLYHGIRWVGLHCLLPWVNSQIKFTDGVLRLLANVPSTQAAHTRSLAEIMEFLRQREAKAEHKPAG